MIVLQCALDLGNKSHTSFDSWKFTKNKVNRNKYPAAIGWVVICLYGDSTLAMRWRSWAKWTFLELFLHKILEQAYQQQNMKLWKKRKEVKPFLLCISLLLRHKQEPCEISSPVSRYVGIRVVRNVLCVFLSHLPPDFSVKEPEHSR